jgi:hypothetical protein
VAETKGQLYDFLIDCYHFQGGGSLKVGIAV